MNNGCVRQFVCILTVLLLTSIILLAVTTGLVLLLVSGAFVVSAAPIFVAVLTFVNGIIAAYVFVRLLVTRYSNSSSGACQLR